LFATFTIGRVGSGMIIAFLAKKDQSVEQKIIPREAN